MQLAWGLLIRLFSLKSRRTNRGPSSEFAPPLFWCARSHKWRCDRSPRAFQRIPRAFARSLAGGNTPPLGKSLPLSATCHLPCNMQAAQLHTPHVLCCWYSPYHRPVHRRDQGGNGHVHYPLSAWGWRTKTQRGARASKVVR
jgi:hypothetical protein